VPHRIHLLPWSALFVGLAGLWFIVVIGNRIGVKDEFSRDRILRTGCLRVS
jgi:hypothetical protein